MHRLEFLRVFAIFANHAHALLRAAVAEASQDRKADIDLDRAFAILFTRTIERTLARRAERARG